MRNKDIKNIDDFKNRFKRLYEYKVHDLNMNKVESVYNMQEDEEAAPQPEPQPELNTQQAEPVNQPEAQVIPQEQPVQEPQPTEPTPQSEPQEDQMLSFLKSEMGKLDNIVSSLESISNNVDMVSQRLDNLNNHINDLSKIVDEIKEPSDIEKLEMRAFDSYPYNKTLNKVWDDKMKSKEEQDMERMGIEKTNDGYQMEYIPNKNFQLNQFNNNI